MKKITFIVEESLIKKAKEKANRENSTLNKKYREWLAQYVSQDAKEGQITKILSKVNYAKSRKSYSREELNHR